MAKTVKQAHSDLREYISTTGNRRTIADFCSLLEQIAHAEVIEVTRAADDRRLELENAGFVELADVYFKACVQSINREAGWPKSLRVRVAAVRDGGNLLGRDGLDILREAVAPLDS